MLAARGYDRHLLLAHPLGVERGLEILNKNLSGQIDILTYGATATSVVAPDSSRVIILPTGGRSLRTVRRALGMLRTLRKSRYASTTIAQPNLGLSRARGPLCAFPFLITGRVATVNPCNATLQPITRRFAAVDLLKWVLLQLLAHTTASIASWLLQLGRYRLQRPPAELPQTGRSLYLRTDLDLALAPLEAGGSLSHTLGILNALERRGLEPELWSTGQIAGLRTSPRGRLVCLIRANLPIEIAELLSGVIQVLRARSFGNRPSVIYQRYSLNNLTGLLLSTRWRVPLILEANCSEVEWRKQWSSLRFPRLAATCERILLRSSDRVVVVSENARAGLLRAGGDPKRIRVVPNGVDFDQFAEVEPMRLDLPPDSFVVAFSGLFYRWHGVPTLAAAFIKLADRVPEARLLLVGAGDQDQLVRSILTEGGVIDRVMMPGLVPNEDVPRYLAAASAVTSPHTDVKDFIGSPIKIFEYMASGKPLVASRVAQMANILTDEKTALLVAPDDPHALADALERLSKDPALAARVGSAAQREALEHHSWDARLSTILGP